MRDRFARVVCETGRVHSVFSNALNILWNDKRLLALHAPGELRAPFAAIVGRVPHQICPGTPVRRAGGSLRVGGVELAADDPVVVETRMPPGDLCTAPWLERMPAQGMAPSLSLPEAREAQRVLAAGIRRRDGGLFVSGASKLIGLGEGLTPAGDDCLVGVLAVLFRFAPAWISHSEVAVRLAGQAENGTTMVGREFLLHALQGSFSEPVLRLLTAASRPEEHAARAALLAFGATSGADTFAGTALALEALRSSSPGTSSGFGHQRDPRLVTGAEET